VAHGEQHLSVSSAGYRHRAETFVGRLDGKRQFAATESHIKQALRQAGDNGVEMTIDRSSKSVAVK
jgi:hypothetical protein